MVRHFVLSFILLLFMVAGLQADDAWTAWGLTGDGADHALTARLGRAFGQFELGGQLSWFTAEPEWGPEPDVAGGFGIFHIDELVTFDDPSPDNFWEEWLHRFVGRPYVGIEGLVPTDGSDRTILINYLAGTLITLAEDEQTAPDWRLAVTVEYAAGQAVASDEDHSDAMVRIGMRYATK